MAKSRITKRGTIRSIVRARPKSKPLMWRQQKAFAQLQNRRQWMRDFDPTETLAIEIQLENGNYLVDESRIDPNASTPDETSTFIIAE
tara:strand:+ start:594 stop:857 length:264 start_codon:yes stop_codon:yes gene_type:complete